MNHFPYVNINLTQTLQPWFTNRLLVSSKRKTVLFKKKLNRPSPENIKMYKIYNRIFNVLKRKMKTLYFKTALEQHKCESKKCWTILKQAIGTLNDKSSYPKSFYINNSQVTAK